MANYIKQEYEAICLVEGNPVAKVLVAVTGNKAVVFMEDVRMRDDNDHDHNPQDPPVSVTPDNGPRVTPPRYDNMNGRSNRDLLLGVMGSMNSLCHSVIKHSNAIEQLHGGIRHQEHTMNSFVCKIDANPLQQLQRAAQGRAQVGSPRWTLQVDTDYDVTAVLSPNPRTLHTPWTEYICGIGNNKAAKFFTAAERGHNKYW